MGDVYDKIEKAFDEVKDLEPEEVGALLGGKVEANFNGGYFENACTIRLSHAFNTVGSTDSSVPKIDYRHGQTVSGASGDWYIYRVGEMEKFVRQYEGDPDITISLQDYNMDSTRYAEIITDMAAVADEHGLELPEYIILARDVATGVRSEEELENYDMPSMIEQVEDWLQLMGQIDARVAMPGLEDMQNYFTAITQLKDLKGIIAYESDTMDDALGHMDLWNGTDCQDACSVDKATTISFWKLGG